MSKRKSDKSERREQERAYRKERLDRVLAFLHLPSTRQNMKTDTSLDTEREIVHQAAMGFRRDAFMSLPKNIDEWTDDDKAIASIAVDICLDDKNLITRHARLREKAQTVVCFKNAVELRSAIKSLKAELENEDE